MTKRIKKAETKIDKNRIRIFHINEYSTLTLLIYLRYIESFVYGYRKLMILVIIMNGN